MRLVSWPRDPVTRSAAMARAVAAATKAAGPARRRRQGPAMAIPTMARAAATRNPKAGRAAQRSAPTAAWARHASGIAANSRPAATTAEDRSARSENCLLSEQNPDHPRGVAPGATDAVTDALRAPLRSVYQPAAKTATPATARTKVNGPTRLL